MLQTFGNYSDGHLNLLSNMLGLMWYDDKSRRRRAHGVAQRLVGLVFRSEIQRTDRGCAGQLPLATPFHGLISPNRGVLRDLTGGTPRALRQQANTQQVHRASDNWKISTARG